METRQVVNTSTASQHFSALEGLRAWLAVWVALGHGLQTAGVLSLSGAASLLLSGDAAVHVFVILSGFVISHLLLAKRESYPEYLVRRFLRLYPAFIFACMLGFGAMFLWGDVVAQMPWSGDVYWQSYRASVEEIVAQSLGNTLPHALLHLTMLHGVLPTEVLPRAPMTFLPAAWSVSLEWQFYLVAPFVIAMLRRGRWSALVVVVVAITMYVLYSMGVFGHFPIGSFLLNGAPYFALGIFSRLVIFQRTSGRALMSGAVLFAFLVAAVLGYRSIGGVVWFGFFTVFCLPQHWMLRRYMLWPVENRLSLMIGRSSYSLYLLHRPVQVLGAWFVVSYATATTATVLASQLAAIVLAILFANQTWRRIEVPWQLRAKALAVRVGGMTDGR